MFTDLSKYAGGYKMETAIQLLFNGLSMGSVYALIALGIVLIINAINIVNFAHGEVVMIGSFVVVSSLVYGQMPLPLAILVGIAFMVPFGFLFHRIAYHRLRNMPAHTVVVCTIGISLFLRNIALIIWGATPYVMPPLAGNVPIRVFNVAIMPQSIIIIVTAIVLLTAQHFFFKSTMLGKKMQATAQDSEAAKLLGIRVNRMTTFTFIYASMLAAIAGILASPITFVEPFMGQSIGLKAFAAIIIGGFGSIPGALVGGLIVGLVEIFAAGYISSAYRDAFPFIVMLIILMVKPEGLFGEKIGEKV